MKEKIKKIGSDKLASLETKMWQAYYGHNFVKLFFLIISLVNNFFGFKKISTLRGSFMLSSAVIDFRLNKGNENKERILRKLTSFSKLLFDKNSSDINYKKAAELELEWWFVDRYPERYGITREKALQEVMVFIFDLNNSDLGDYAKYRAQAMVLQDKAEEQSKKTDWKEVEVLLKKSYSSLCNLL